MKTSKFGEMIFSEDDVIDMVMRGQQRVIDKLLVEPGLTLEQAVPYLESVPDLVEYVTQEMTIEEWDRIQQGNWHMPQEYKNLDIAEYVLGLCKTQEQLQRAGRELMLFQERDLFDLLRYLKYLVDVMQENHVIWGVGRGSSVASYVLYLLGVHRIDSMFYDLDPGEFLR